jgi:HK97 family phage portal protein
MTTWLKSPEERSNPLENPRNPLAQAFFIDGQRTITGRSMSDTHALSLPAIYSAVSHIAGDMATVPLSVYRRRADGGREKADHRLNEILGLQPQPMVSAATWREAIQGHVLLRGNGYAEIIMDSGGRVLELRLLSPSDVFHIKGSEFYKVHSQQRLIHMASMLHLAGPGGDGISGWSVLQLAKNNWALASALEEANTRFIANAARPSGVITSPNPITAETAKRLKSMWAANNSGLDSVGKTPVLDNGMEWQQVGVSAEDAQFLESRQFSITDISRWFNIPPHMIGDLERATFSNIEEQAIQYVRNTLRPWAVRHEQQMDTKLLTAKERADGLFVSYNLDGLLRGDISSRTDAYQSMFRMGGLTPNEMRALENRNPVEGGDVAYVSADMVPLDKIEELLAPPAAPEPDPEPVQENSERRREVRGHQDRMTLRKSFHGLLLDAAGRMVRGEVRNIRRLMRNAEGDMDDLIARYYFDEHPEFATRTMGPAFRAYARSVALAAAQEIETDTEIDAEAFADAYTEGFVARYSARSRRDLDGRDAPEIEQRLQEWGEGTATAAPRMEQVADQEAVKVGDAVARQLFIAAGVSTLVWRTIGDNCPYCARLNGKVVGSNQSFILAGEQFQGEGTDTPLVTKNNVRHAPAHKGCNCTIVPGGVGFLSERPAEEVRQPVTVNVQAPTPTPPPAKRTINLVRDENGKVVSLEMNEE